MLRKKEKGESIMSEYIMEKENTSFKKEAVS
ncbi:hypothetical protein PB1_11769 [Bacillus methanolicus PB1]|uniref:Uncharacterized protein n=1 Tax=Bacillus methanolicus PB1 TaxID=997296 RepID=I3DVG5_BACMT|nr:hypothetical protein PB1_11769 [Bacillus methanolicus PB1]